MLGSVPVDSEILKSVVMGIASSGAKSLSILLGIPSGPIALLVSRACNSLSTSSGSTVSSLRAGSYLTSISGMGLLGSLENKLWKNLFRMLALVTESVKSLLP